MVHDECGVEDDGHGRTSEKVDDADDDGNSEDDDESGAPATAASGRGRRSMLTGWTAAEWE